jgi:hypothetical protein
MKTLKNINLKQKNYFQIFIILEINIAVFPTFLHSRQWKYLQLISNSTCSSIFRTTYWLRRLGGQGGKGQTKMKIGFPLLMLR